MQILKIIITIIGALLFLFVFWRRLKEDYTQGQIFSTGFYMILLLSLGYFIAKFILPAWWFWFVLLGLSGGLIVGVLRFQLRIFEVIEAATLGSITWLWVMAVYNFITNAHLESLLIATGLLLLFSLFFYFDSHYKSFVWYRSGRVGFSGLMILGIFFLVRAGIAAYFPTMISFVGKSDIIVSAVFSFVAFLGVFSLARLGL